LSSSSSDGDAAERAVASTLFMIGSSADECCTAPYGAPVSAVAVHPGGSVGVGKFPALRAASSSLRPSVLVHVAVLAVARVVVAVVVSVLAVRQPADQA
jgi:hypothetical protein